MGSASAVPRSIICWPVCVNIMNLHAKDFPLLLLLFSLQCGRFQLLSDFEGAKRSCRAKLELHNARRKQARAAAATCGPNPSSSSMSPCRSSCDLDPSSLVESGTLDNPFSKGATSADQPSVGDASPDTAMAPGIPAAPAPRILELDMLLDELDMGISAEDLFSPDVFDPALPLLANALVFPQHIGVEVPPAQQVIEQPQLLPIIDAEYASLQAAGNLLSTHHRQAPAVTFAAPADLARASLKLFNVQPSELPSAIYNELQVMMQNQVCG